ncbi:hypothetical protein MesoLj113a_06430 [Mesorhizobium sp. 113-1-2]|nr:hypothetical protein MesoLj113a_06430 [Mesorhizobium sp. 113-1-2]
MGGGLAGAVAGALASVFVAITNYANRDRELDIKMVEISLSILKGDQDDRSVNARTFAIKALSKYSGVPIDQKTIEDWALNGTLPFNKVSISSEQIPAPYVSGWTDEDTKILQEIIKKRAEAPVAPAGK